jgi:hypothetical protein
MPGSRTDNDSLVSHRDLHQPQVDSRPRHDTGASRSRETLAGDV